RLSLDEATLLHKRLQQLFGEKRVALRSRVHQRHQLVRDSLARQLLANEPACFLHSEGLDVHLVGLTLAHQLAQGLLQRVFSANLSVTVAAHEQDARPLEVPTEVQQQRQTRSIGPVQVVQQ